MNNSKLYLNRLVALGVVLLTLFVVVYGSTAWTAEKQNQIGEMRTALELSEKALDRYFVQSEAALKGLSGDLQAVDGLHDTAAARRLLKRFAELHQEVSFVTLVHPKGQVLASSAVTPSGRLPNLADDLSFQEFMATAARSGDRLLLSRPMAALSTGKWIFPMRRALRDGEGRIVGVVTAALPVDLLQGFWRAAPLVQRASIGLLRDDGYLLSRYPVHGAMTPQDIYGQRQDGPVARYVRTHEQPADGYVEGANNLTGTQVAAVMRRLEHYPVTLFVSMPLSEFTLAWWHRVRVPYALVAVLAVIGWFGDRYARARWLLHEAERQRVEQELRVSEEEQRFLIDHLPVAIAMHGPNGTMLRCNPQALALLGLSPAQAVGLRLRHADGMLRRSDGSVMPSEEHPVARVIRSCEPISETVFGVQRIGWAEPIWLLCNVVPEFDNAGALRRVVTSFVDITERRRAERTLERSEVRYRMMFENSLDGVLLTRADGSILSANRAALAIFRSTEAELIALGLAGLTDGGDLRLATLLQQRVDIGHAKGEITMIRVDGTRFEAEVSAAQYQDPGGDWVSSIFMRDVTDRRRMEAAVAAKEVAENANRAKSRFVAHMSHELRTPLNAILGFSEVLQVDRSMPLPDRHRARVEHIRQAGRHLLSMIEDLLDLSHIESGALKLTMSDIDPVEIARQAIHEVNGQARAARVAVRLDAEQRSVGAMRGDRTRLRQILLNLLSNAIKYNRPGGEVSLRLSTEPTTLSIAVRDSGLGMNKQQVEALFQPFNRLGREMSGIEGSGIGLVVTKSLIDAMEGRLEVSSREGEGTEFRIRLPRVAVARWTPAPATAPMPLVPLAPHAPSGAMPLSAQSGSQSIAAAPSSIRVLYIDDCAVNRTLVEAALETRADLQLTLASDGAEGLALARTIRPRVVLTDMMMPTMTGTDVLHRMRQDKYLHAIPCVAVSASAMPREIDAAMAAGFDGYLTKPIAISVLLREIDRALALRPEAVSA